MTWKPTSSTWTDERTELAKALWLKGYSASQIAKELRGITRNAVIGKLHRMGLKRAAPTLTRPRSTGGIKLGAGALAAARKRSAEAALPKPAPEPRYIHSQNGLSFKIACGEPFGAPLPPRAIPKANAFDPLPGSTPKPWTQRRFGQCAFPVGGVGEDVLSCCEPCLGTYCAPHRQLMIAPAPSAHRTEAQKIGDAKRRATMRRKAAERRAA